MFKVLSEQCKEFWYEFLMLYKNLPALWNVKCDMYKNKKKKAQAYELLIEKLKEIEPQPSREKVVRKINSFRTNYRRERRKVLKSDGSYTSTIWYYDLFSFLHENEEEESSEEHITVSNIWLDEENEVELTQPKEFDDMGRLKQNKTEDGTSVFAFEEQLPEENTVDLQNYEAEARLHKRTRTHEMQTRKNQSSSAKQFKRKKQQPLRLCDNGKVLKMDHMEEANRQNGVEDVEFEECRLPQTLASSDEAKALASVWACQFKDLPSRQKIYVQKMISDIFYYGCLGVINANTVAGLDRSLRQANQRVNDSEM